MIRSKTGRRPVDHRRVEGALDDDDARPVRPRPGQLGLGRVGVGRRGPAERVRTVDEHTRNDALSQGVVGGVRLVSEYGEQVLELAVLRAHQVPLGCAHEGILSPVRGGGPTRPRRR